MPQFFLPPGAVSGERFKLEGPEAFHVARVLRLKAGDALTLFDGRGGRFEGLIESTEGGTVAGRITSTLEARTDYKAPPVHLYQGLLKGGGHWELVLEKGTELGVASFTPLLTPRTVVLLREAERTKAKEERWQRILMASAKQCQRAELPELRAPTQFRDAIKGCRDAGGLAFVAWEGLRGSGAARVLREPLQEAREAGRAVSLFVGPEGGFSDEEIELAESLGALCFGLGSRVLRAETAGLVACALVQYELGAL